MKQKKIFIQLIGGLGNQLFQYSCAKNLSLTLNSKLFIDDKTYMFFDKVFKRKKELPMNLGYSEINLIDRIKFIILIIIKKKFFAKRNFISIFNNIIIDETTSLNKYLNLKKITNKYQNIFLVGFFQNERYFYENRKTILDSILKNNISNEYLKKISKNIKKSSIMIGARLYEEIPKNLKKNFGKTENLNYYLVSMNIFRKKIKKTKFIIFSSSLKRLNFFSILDKNTQLVDGNFAPSAKILDYLLLFSNFKNFIISNSTFYWWGAYISEYKNKKINIICSNKFLSKDLKLNRWKHF